MKLKDFSLLFFMLTIVHVTAQTKVSGVVTSKNNAALHNVEIYDAASGKLTTTNSEGFYEFETAKINIKLIFYAEEYQVFETEVSLNGTSKMLDVQLEPYGEKLSEVIITAQKRRVFNLKRLKDVEETAIYAGKKTEVVLVEQSMANLASNNARQIYSQVAGLNIFQNDDAGLQLNIGGRGLDPNRTANFNTRQNGYDISADVLGYPESYYTPPAEALEEIQVIRGAASLQYGTQFGGLVNFKFKAPKANDPFEIVTRNTVGSNGLFTNFTSVSGTKSKLSYYSYFNYKKGDGFRPNSGFDSKNAHLHLGYAFNEKTTLKAELTYLNYLAQQAGGLTDAMFNENPFQSNRTRNWFEVDWLLYNLKLSHQFSENTNFTFNFFGLDAERKALGFRGNYTKPSPNPVIDVDEQVNGEYIYLRDLIRGGYNNFGFEARILSNYKLFNKENTFLIGAKYYDARNTEAQGAASKGTGPSFSFVDANDYISSNFKLPNQNIAIFGENIIRFSDQFTITPGFRFEYINTQSNGSYTVLRRDAAGNVINTITKTDDRENKRNFFLFGIGASYKPSVSTEMYTNLSQNYRSVTFSDIRTVNPSFAVDENLTDSRGYTFDIGLRGNWKKYINYDISGFGLFYNDRIAIVTESEGPRKGDPLRTNVGDALILGVESLIEWNIMPTFNVENKDYIFTVFNNLSVINSENTKTTSNYQIEGKEVEFVPKVNLKSGVRFGYKNFLSNLQFTYLSDQFSDASNATETNTNGTKGKIPSYNILDFSLSYKYKFLKLEAGINNVLDNYYFTRRATGYPGPGIIPSAPRNWYTTLQLKF